MKQLFLTTIFISLFIIFNCRAQSNIRVDPILEMNAEQFNLQRPLELWLNFLKSENDQAASIYWNQSEIREYGDSKYFLLKDLDYFEIGDIVSNLKNGITILSISENNGIYKITSKFDIKINDSTFVNPFIFHVYAKSSALDEELKLFNPLPINLDLHTRSQTVRNIEYFYLKSHRFERKKAMKQCKLIKKISKEYALALSDYQFLFTDDRESMYRISGYDFHFQSMGLEQPSGFADVDSRIVYSYGCGEYYPHELIHLFINPVWTSSHNWLLEGFATYYGGSRGKSLDWHLNKLGSHLKAHPEINLNDMLELRNMDMTTGYQYALGGYIIKLAYDKGGADLVRKIMESGKSDLEFYAAIEKYLGIKRNELNDFLRKNLEN